MKIGYCGIVPYVKWEKVINQEILLSRCDKIIVEKASWIAKGKMTLNQVISNLTPKDELVICDLKYLAPDTKQLIQAIELIESKQAKLTVLNIKEGLAGKFSALKSFESYVASAKIKKGQKKVKHNSEKVIGRKLQLTESEKSNVLNLWDTGRYTVTELAEQRGLSRRSIYRIINKEERNDGNEEENEEEN
jgi:DNA invertase Pin-like site-specific DNA recombinase